MAQRLPARLDRIQSRSISRDNFCFALAKTIWLGNRGWWPGSGSRFPSGSESIQASFWVSSRQGLSGIIPCFPCCFSSRPMMTGSASICFVGLFHQWVSRHEAGRDQDQQVHDPFHRLHPHGLLHHRGLSCISWASMYRPRSSTEAVHLIMGGEFTFSFGDS